MALNNRGVSMMAMAAAQAEGGGGGGGSLLDAINIFKDSFAVLSLIHAIPSGGEFGDIFLATTTAVSQQEHQVPGDASSSSSAQAAASRRYLQTNVSSSLRPLEICPCDDVDISFQASTVPYISKFVPIHLRSRDFYDDRQDEHADLVLAIVMYNHGLAHLLAHLQDKKTNYTSSSTIMGCGLAVSSTQHGRKLLRGAVAALNFSQVMIDRHLHAIAKHDEENGGGRRREAASETLRGLVVSAMTLKAMMWTSRLDRHENHQDHEHQADHESAAIKVGTKLSNVLVDMDRYQDELRQLNVNMCQDGNPTTSTAAWKV
jgi:hypothetical protein